MLYYFSFLLKDIFGPFRLLHSYAILIGLAIFIGFLITVLILPKTYRFLPKDRGREFTLHPEHSTGKPTGAGVVFISIFIILSFIIFIPSIAQIFILCITWLVMLSGFLDDKTTVAWGEYKKALIDFVLSSIAASGLFVFYFNGAVSYWLPFTNKIIAIHPALYFFISIILLWTAINATNCSDGVDGLSATLILLELFTLGAIFYFILGHSEVANYLLVPHIADGADWAILIFCLTGVVMGYLWHNAFPGKVLMGDAGSRALGFFTGIIIIVSKNPFLILITGGMIFLNGGTGLLKVALLRFFNIRIFKKIRFPLHDHMQKNLGWSATQVLLKFIILQIVMTIILLGILFKIR